MKTEKQIQQRIDDLKQLKNTRLMPEMTPKTTIRCNAQISILKWILSDKD